eukprot:1157706-Pelagomonas_calceolata.AAC.4
MLIRLQVMTRRSKWQTTKAFLNHLCSSSSPKGPAQTLRSNVFARVQVSPCIKSNVPAAPDVAVRSNVPAQAQASTCIKSNVSAAPDVAIRSNVPAQAQASTCRAAGPQCKAARQGDWGDCRGKVRCNKGVEIQKLRDIIACPPAYNESQRKGDMNFKTAIAVGNTP